MIDIHLLYMKTALMEISASVRMYVFIRKVKLNQEEEKQKYSVSMLQTINKIIPFMKPII